jgi:hypothetical protein
MPGQIRKPPSLINDRVIPAENEQPGLRVISVPRLEVPPKARKDGVAPVLVDPGRGLWHPRQSSRETVALGNGESNTSCVMIPRIGTEEPTLVVVAICCLGTGVYLISRAGRRREPPRRWYLNDFEHTIQVNARSSCRLPAHRYLAAAGGNNRTSPLCR